MLRLRLTENERVKLAEQVREAGYKDQSEYLRRNGMMVPVATRFIDHF